jgi:Protein of unknown function (DUF3618)
MAQTSDELKRDIERTRDEMGDTVEALAYKADVPSRTKDWLGDKRDSVVSKLSGTSDQISEAMPDGGEVRKRAGWLKATAERNPLGLALAGSAVGFVVGLLTPSTRIENEQIGPVADEVKSAAAETGREAIERGKIVAQEAGTAAMETAKEVGEDQKEELTTSLQSQARETLESDAQRSTSQHPDPLLPQGEGHDRDQ